MTSSRCAVCHESLSSTTLTWEDRLAEWQLTLLFPADHPTFSSITYTGQIHVTCADRLRELARENISPLQSIAKGE